MSEPKIAPMTITPEEIPDKLYFRIGEVARLAGIKPYVLRFWETEFPRWIRRNREPDTASTAARKYSWCWRSSACSTKSATPSKAPVSFWIAGLRTATPARPRRQVSRKDLPESNPWRASQNQTGFFDVPSPLLETVRKELLEIAEMLK